jgi:hypothetical protein
MSDKKTYVYATSPNPVGKQPFLISDHPVDEPGLFLLRVFDVDAALIKDALREKGEQLEPTWDNMLGWEAGS